jgi:hypothetical protein
MKAIFLVLLNLLAISAFPQESLHFDLKVIVTDLHNKEPQPDTRVRVVNQDNDLIFEGCTDATGEVLLGRSLILPNSTYTITLTRTGFFEDLKGVKLTTVGLQYSQHFVMDLCLLKKLTCRFFSGYTPVPGNRKQEFAALAEDIRLMRNSLAEEYGEDYAIHELAVAICYSTKAEEKAMRKEAELLIKTLGKTFPGMKVRREIVVDHPDDHHHMACLRVDRMP